MQISIYVYVYIHVYSTYIFATPNKVLHERTRVNTMQKNWHELAVSTLQNPLGEMPKISSAACTQYTNLSGKHAIVHVSVVLKLMSALLMLCRTLWIQWPFSIRFLFVSRPSFTGLLVHKLFLCLFLVDVVALSFPFALTVLVFLSFPWLSFHVSLHFTFFLSCSLSLSFGLILCYCYLLGSSLRRFYEHFYLVSFLLWRDCFFCSFCSFRFSFSFLLPLSFGLLIVLSLSKLLSLPQRTEHIAKACPIASLPTNGPSHVLRTVASRRETELYFDEGPFGAIPVLHSHLASKMRIK